ncbi:MAG TPA: PAS domain-containing protein, partial [Streptomyces sp.]|nr:PAS domain-containing protein [Streptomyces sp.]
MNFTRWSARLPGTQRRTSAAQAAQAAAAQAQQTSERESTERAAASSGTADGADSGTPGTADGVDAGADGGAESVEGASSTVPAARAERRGAAAAGPAGLAGSDSATATEGPDAPLVQDAPPAPAGETEPSDAAARTGETSAAADTPSALVTRSIDALSVHDLLGQVPALAAVVHGADHRVAYVNDAYTAVFGHRVQGEAARDALPELVELGLLPLMDQVLRSGKPRTVKSRRVAGAADSREGADGREPRDAFYTFTCTPITADGESGVLIFAADVTDQVE